MVFDESPQTAEFNMAVSYLNRLNQVLYMVAEARAQQDIYLWFKNLELLYAELIQEFTEDEQKEIDKNLKEKYIVLDRWHNIAMKGKGSRVEPVIYWWLHEFEAKLRRRMDSKGLIIKRSSDDLRLIK